METMQKSQFQININAQDLEQPSRIPTLLAGAQKGLHKDRHCEHPGLDPGDEAISSMIPAPGLLRSLQSLAMTTGKFILRIYIWTLDLIWHLALGI